MKQTPAQAAATLLKRTGILLHGDDFRSALARDLHVQEKTLRQWLAGDRDIPGGLWEDLARIIDQRQSRLRRAMWHLNTEMRLSTVERPDGTPF